MPGRDELRERLRGPEGYETWNACVDDVFAEIEKAGYVLVKADRWERVQAAASHYHATSPGWRRFLQPGDLDVEAGA